MRTKVAPPPVPLATTPHFDFEREAFANGHRWVAGVDEVGRGPLAGPVGVAAVILDPDDLPEGLDDSKALPAPKRESLSEVIFAKALSVSIVFASVEEIDAFNIRGAALRAMARAIAALSLRPDLALIDGRDAPDGLDLPGASDHWRRRSFDVDRRRLHRRQDDPRCVHAQSRARLS